jgi:hypothetical protein
MRDNAGILLTLLLCCGWPLIVHFGIDWALGLGRRIDWKNIEWPWRKHD